MAVTEICLNCRFWQKPKVAHSATGECHRFAPIPGSDSEQARWPLTDSGQWCGEFQPRLPGKGISEEYKFKR